MNLNELSKFGKKSAKKTFSWVIAYENFATIESAFNQKFSDKDELRNKLRTKGLLNDKLSGIVESKIKTAEMKKLVKSLVNCFVVDSEIDELKKICKAETIDAIKELIK